MTMLRIDFRLSYKLSYTCRPQNLTRTGAVNQLFLMHAMPNEALYFWDTEPAATYNLQLDSGV